MNLPWLTVFLSGTHKTSAPKKTWTEEDVKTIVKNTKEKGEERIPFTFDHPDDNLPIVGWFRREDIRLGEYDGRPAVEVKPAEFAGGAEGFRSISKSAFNKPSIMVGIADKIIKHIGLVERPAVVDIPAFDSYSFSAAFSDSSVEKYEACFEIGSTAYDYEIRWKMQSIADGMTAFREYIIAEKGIDVADKVISKQVITQILTPLPSSLDSAEWAIRDIVSKAIANQLSRTETGQPMPITSIFKHTDMDAQTVEAKFANLEADLKKISAENESLRTSNNQLQAKLERAEFSAYAQQLLAQKKIAPGEVEEVIENLTLRHNADTSAGFSADSKDSKLNVYKQQLESRTASTALFTENKPGYNHDNAEFKEDDDFINNSNKARGF